MSTSLPSSEIYAIDVQDKRLNVKFKYNFFVADESIVENSGIPIDFNHKSFNSDLDYEKYFQTRIPRYVQLNWNSNIQINNVQNSNTVKSTLIADHYDKIISEDQFSSYNFVSINYADADISNKLYELVSGSCNLFLQDTHNLSKNKIAAAMQEILPSQIDSQFVSNILSDLTTQNVFKNSLNELTFNNYVDKLQSANITTQINNNALLSLTQKNLQDPQTTYSSNLKQLQTYAQTISSKLKDISEDEFKICVTPFKIEKKSTVQNQQTGEIVGYIIDKYECVNNTLQKLQPIIVETPNTHCINDAYVKYNQTYAYSIRTVAKFAISAISINNNEVSTIWILVSSKPSCKQYVKIQDNVAPPPPTDINFTFNYELQKLMLSWVFPINPQRDIKRFQIFRRESIQHPFELIKEYDFDDSAVRKNNGELPNKLQVEHLKNSVCFYYDDDFNKNSNYIYALCAIDAHGLTSNYSSQNQVKFDVNKNVLYKKLISHSGAPKPYPNMFIEGNAFIDTINVKNMNKMKLYFCPQNYYLIDDKNRATDIFVDSQKGMYKFQFINTDVQKSEILTVKINDKTKKNFDSKFLK
jgi:hypothetical protein